VSEVEQLRKMFLERYIFQHWLKSWQPGIQDVDALIAAARAEALEDAKMGIHNHEEEFNRQFSAMRSKAPDMVTDNHGWQCKYAGRCEAFGEARNAIEALKEKKP